MIYHSLAGISFPTFNKNNTSILLPAIAVNSVCSLPVTQMLLQLTHFLSIYMPKSINIFVFAKPCAMMNYDLKCTNRRGQHSFLWLFFHLFFFGVDRKYVSKRHEICLIFVDKTFIQFFFSFNVNFCTSKSSFIIVLSE